MNWSALTIGVPVAVVGMFLAWVVSVRKRDAGVVDVVWAASIGLLSVLYALTSEGTLLPRALGGLLGGVWGFRLAIHLAMDRVIGAEEDGRYKRLREYWGPDADRKFFWFFQAQAVAAIFFSLPFLSLTSQSREAITALEILSLVVWIVSIAGEAAADRQLKLFRRNPANRGKTCRSGLWSYSRHPNYFFEWLHWCVYPVLLFGSPGFWLSILCPVVMLFSLLRVTGIPYAEAQAIRTRGEDYISYQRTTSMFFPWFRKSEAA